MAAALAVFLTLLLSAGVRAVCPDSCDCQHAQRLLCTNRGLRVVPEVAASGSSDVLVLSLAGNFISNVSALDLTRFSHLTRLDLQFNRVRSLHPKAFHTLAHLQELYLGNNLLPGISPGTLQPLKKLRILDANRNEIEKIAPDTFLHLGSLIKLRLDGNSIQTLQESVFRGLENLLYLHLESNRLRHIHRNALAGLEKLRFLNLSDNRLTALRGAALFSPLPALTRLLLTGNQIQHVGSRVFQKLGSLTRLSLSNNNISALAPGALGGLPRLRELLLDGNRLAGVPGGLLEPLPALQELDLRGNAWRCDCALAGLRDWIRRAHASGRLLAVFVRCSAPPGLAGKYLDHLDDAQLQPAGNRTCASTQPGAGLQADQGRPSQSQPSKHRKGGAPWARPRLHTAVSLKRVRAEPPLATPSATPLSLAVPPPSLATGLVEQRQQRPLEATACQLNDHFLWNVSAERLGHTSARVYWELRPLPPAPPPEALQFRVRYDRFAAPTPFPRFLYLGGGARAAVLRELGANQAYVACVESVVGGAVCGVASRDHCAGVVTQAAPQSGGVDLQLVTVVTLAANALLLLAVGGAWVGRGLRRRLQRRTSAVNIRHMYSTRRPLRAMATEDFTAYQSSRPRGGGADEGDLIQFACDRYLDNNLACRDDAMQRFQD